MFFSTRSYYGTRAMLELARLASDGPVHLETLAANQDIPERYLAKIVQDLRRGGLIRSVRGAHGGYMLARDPAGISLWDIVTCLEGSLAPVDCVEFPEFCDQVEQCVTREVWQRMHDAVRRLLESKTLQGMADGFGRSMRKAKQPVRHGR